MQTSVLVASGAVTQQSPVFTDTVSIALGNGVDKCGPRHYAISITPNALETAFSPS